MKKYWKLGFLTLFIVATFSSYYVYSSNISASFAAYEFETLEGDATYAEPIVLKGAFHGPYRFDESIKVTSEGTSYLRDGSLGEQWDFYGKTEKIKHLQKNYKQFMRLKGSASDTFVETDKYIIYSDIKYSRFGTLTDELMLAVYDKETKKERDYTIQLPHVDRYAYVEYIGMNGDEVYLVVEDDVYNDSLSESRKITYRSHVITFNLTEEKVTNEIEITSISDERYSNFFKVLVDNEEAPEQMIISTYVVRYDPIVNVEETEEEYNVDVDYDDYYEYGVIESLHVVDLRTQEVEEINIAEENSGLPIGYNRDQLILANVIANELYLTAYDFKEEKIVKNLNVNMNTSYLPMWEVYNARTKDGYYYLINGQDSNFESGTIAVIDLEELTLNYKGKVKQTRENRFNDSVNVSFHELDLKY